MKTNMIIGKETSVVKASQYYFNEELIEATISDGVKKIEDWAFGYCTNLVRIFISKSVEFISPNAFDGCESLEEIHVDPNNQFYSSVDGVLYSKDCTKLIRFPSNHKSEKYIIAETVNELENLSFNRCLNLQEVVFPSGLTTIGEKAFAYCGKITTLTIPNTVQIIRDYAFSDCYSLEKILLNNDMFSTVNDVLYKIENNIKTLIQYPLAKKAREFTIPSDVSKIKDRAFIGAKYLFDIHAPNSNFFWSKDGVLYETHLKRLMCLPSQKRIETLIVPSEIEVIGNSSLKMNQSLKKIVFPQKLVIIERHAVEDCVSLEEVHFTGTSLKRLEWSAFWGCRSLKSIDLSMQEKLYIDSLAFAKCEKLEKVFLPSIHSMGRGVFKDCKNLSKN